MELSTADYYKQIKTAEVAELLGVSNSTVWSWVKQGIIPEPRYATPRHPKWKLGEVIEAHERHLDETNIKPSGIEGVKGIQPVVAGQKKTSKLEPDDSIAKRLKNRFGIGSKSSSE